MQDGINLYVTHDRLNNAIFRHKLHPISKIIFACLKTFDAQNSVVSSVLRELDTGKKFIVSDLAGKAPKTRPIDGIMKWLDALRKNNIFNIDHNSNNNKNDKFSSPPSPSAFNDFIPPILPPPPPPVFNNLSQLPPPIFNNFNQPSPPTCNNAFSQSPKKTHNFNCKIYWKRNWEGQNLNQKGSLKILTRPHPRYLILLKLK